jgi:hypothetical protein
MAQREEVLKNSAANDRERLAKRSRDARSAVADIGEIPPVKDPSRRAKAKESLRYFLTTYFPNSTGLSPLCQEQINVIERLEVALLEEGWVCNIMPRGFVKSTISENSILWAMLFGVRSYILFFAGTAALAETGIDSIKRELQYNELLQADFPEACFPIMALEGKAMRAPTQTYEGELTNIQCKGDTLRLAMIPGADCSGAIVEAYGLLAPPRGARYKNEKGANVRPDFAVLDDPQTDDSATSMPQTAKRLDYIHSSISMMGGHGNELSMVCNATIKAEGDLADQLSDPTSDVGENWQSVRVAMISSMPKHLDDLWLTDYAKIRRSYDRNDPWGRIKAKYASTEFYKSHRKKMDEGAVATWENIGLEKTEISAIQHAMNILIDKKEATFWSECQNAPLRPSVAAPLHMEQDELLERYNNFGYGVIPDGRSNVVFHVDVHDEVLYWTAAAVSQDFTGDAIAWGTWPEQPNDWFNLRSAKKTLSMVYATVDSDTAIEHGVRDLLSRLLDYKWSFSNRTQLPVSCGLVDAGYKAKEVANAIRSLQCGDRVMTAKGIPSGPRRKPMPEYDMSEKRVLRCGPDPEAPRWYYPIENIDGGVLRVHFDANFWKSVIASRLTQVASEGAWHLWGDRRQDHGHYVSHLLAERPSQVTAEGRTVNVWEVRGSKDNHWWDTLVGCSVAASMMGCVLPTESVLQIDEPEQTTTASKVDTPRLETPDGRPFFVTAR